MRNAAEITLLLEGSKNKIVYTKKIEFLFVGNELRWRRQRRCGPTKKKSLPTSFKQSNTKNTSILLLFYFGNFVSYTSKKILLSYLNLKCYFSRYTRHHHFSAYLNSTHPQVKKNAKNRAGRKKSFRYLKFQSKATT